MPRLETSTRYVELRRVGNRIFVRRGSLDGRETVHEEQRTSGWASEAVHQLAGMIASLEAEGWRLRPWAITREGLVDERSPFESTLAHEGEHDPHDPHAQPSREPWSVHADWLASRGDARAELIALALAELREPYESLLARRRHEWFGELAELAERGALLRWTWSRGYLRELEIGGGPGPLDLDLHAPNDLAPVLLEVLRHPCARLLERLRVGGLDRTARRDLARVLAPIAELELPRLRRLELGVAGRSEKPSYVRIGELGRLDRFVDLRALRVHGELRSLPPSRALEQLELEVPDLPAALVEGLLARAWPNLRRLWVVSERKNPWANVPRVALRVALARLIGERQLRELGLQGGAILRTMLDDDAIVGLDELRVVRIDDADAELLTSRHASLTGITRLVVEQPMLERGLDRLRERFGDRLHVVRSNFAELARDVLSTTHRAAGWSL